MVDLPNLRPAATKPAASCQLPITIAKMRRTLRLLVLLQVITVIASIGGFLAIVASTLRS